MAGLLLAGRASNLNAYQLDIPPLRPPPVYRVWWRELEACAGRLGDFDHIRWFQVGDSTVRLFREPTAGIVMGLWVAPHSIYLAGAWVRDETTVKHEMLHELLQKGEDGHRDPAFAECGIP